MSPPRKSARKRVNISYANLLDDESDDDFFVDKLQVKHTKRKKPANSDDEYAEDPPPPSPLTKQKSKKPTNPSCKMRKAEEAMQSALKSNEDTSKPLSKQPLITPPNIGVSPTVKPIRNALPQTSIQAEPLEAPAITSSSSLAVPVSSVQNSLFCVSPSSGLRVGLSRKNIRKPLHPNIRLSN
ncbi:hypothetical protein Aperf_G00000050661 [Anoplocephala perfoliata]